MCSFKIIPILLISIALSAFSITTNPVDEIRTSTFSIVAYDPETQEWGVAVASRVLAVGYIVPWAKADVGAIATQALANMDYGILGLDFLEKGFTTRKVHWRLCWRWILIVSSAR